jgi:hypothetical protein
MQEYFSKIPKCSSLLIMNWFVLVQIICSLSRIGSATRCFAATTKVEKGSKYI